MAGMEGIEPSSTEPESAVLPLDYIPVKDCGKSSKEKFIKIRVTRFKMNQLVPICKLAFLQ